MGKGTVGNPSVANKSKKPRDTIPLEDLIKAAEDMKVNGDTFEQPAGEKFIRLMSERVILLEELASVRPTVRVYFKKMKAAKK